MTRANQNNIVMDEQPIVSNAISPAREVFEPVIEPRRNFYTPQERDSICKDIIASIEQGATERQACAQAGIAPQTFTVWILRSSHVEQYTRAMVALAATQVAHIDEITAKLEAKEIAPDAARVIIDARKWFASKFLPKQYGETRSIDVSGTITHTAGELTEQQIRERLAALAAPE